MRHTPRFPRLSGICHPGHSACGFAICGACRSNVLPRGLQIPVYQLPDYKSGRAREHCNWQGSTICVTRELIRNACPPMSTSLLAPFKGGVSGMRGRQGGAWSLPFSETSEPDQQASNNEPSTLLPLTDVRSTGPAQASGSATVTYRGRQSK
ncbi:hypothetical protein FHS90_001938 [Rufibacter quisquiliarum]|uniref:Uncharacterized protein n=1 Tax=Rufibacter quisquiliarum TaxID=1549639 RepID=A0A839GQQ0_9BACT|nr:hypothetical protein [Rufibacter quisquiliarum]